MIASIQTLSTAFFLETSSSTLQPPSAQAQSCYNLYHLSSYLICRHNSINASTFDISRPLFRTVRFFLENLSSLASTYLVRSSERFAFPSRTCLIYYSQPSTYLVRSLDQFAFSSRTCLVYYSKHTTFDGSRSIFRSFRFFSDLKLCLHWILLSSILYSIGTDRFEPFQQCLVQVVVLRVKRWTIVNH